MEGMIGEVRMAAYSFAPKNWAHTAGQILPIVQNQALFSLLGTTYGGNGATTFALPRLNGVMPIGYGNSALGFYSWGQIGGQETVILNQNQMPIHNHSLNAAADLGRGRSFAGKSLATSRDAPTYSNQASSMASAGSTTLSGGSQAHNNLQPLLVGNYCISLYGVFPSRN